MLNPSDHFKRRLVILLALAVFLINLGLSLWHSDFPYYYHPDEPGKVAQVMSGERNYHHPPLMLNATALLLQHSGLTTDADRVVRYGRFLSAVCIATADALLTLLAGYYGAALGASLAACLLSSNPLLIEAGHYFKEDTWLTLGIALTVTAGAWRWHSRRPAALFALGLAAGFAASSKYLGIVTLFYATVLETSMTSSRVRASLWVRLGWLWVSALATIVLLNIGAWHGHVHQLLHGLANATHAAQGGNDLVGERVPNLHILAMFLFYTPLISLSGLVCAFLFLRHNSWRDYADRWLLTLAPLTLLAILSFSSLSAIRYLVPISALVACLSGLGIARALQQSKSASFIGLMVVTCALWQIPSLLRLENGFASDDRRTLRTWIAQNLPPKAMIAEDELAEIDRASPLSQTVVSKKYVADLGELADLRAQGITHILVCWYSSRRFLEPGKRAGNRVSGEFARRRLFYLNLTTETRPIWQSDLGQPTPLRPGLSLYQL